MNFWKVHLREQEGALREMSSMKDKYFMDTNVIVYLFSNKETKKKKIATELFKKAHASSNGVISYQVIQEFCNVALRKFEKPLSLEECKAFITKFLYPICMVYPGNEIFNTAIDMKLETGYSFYDSLILAAAFKDECKVIYSEDMSNGQFVRKMKIVNPF